MPAQAGLCRHHLNVTHFVQLRIIMLLRENFRLTARGALLPARELLLFSRGVLSLHAGVTLSPRAGVVLPPFGRVALTLNAEVSHFPLAGVPVSGSCFHPRSE